MAVTRQHVLNTLVFLIVSMIIINLYTFVIVMSTLTEESNLKLMQKSINGELYNDNGSNNNKEPLGVKTHSVEVIEPNDVISTVRFVRESNGRLNLFVPRGAPITDLEYQRLGRQIFKKLEELGYPPHEYVDGKVRIIGRLRRAFVGSDSAFGVSLNTLYPGAIWQNIAKWPFSDKVFLEATLGQILQYASTAKIFQARLSQKGTQLKLNLILDGGQIALFKPRWYSRNIELHGDVYGGKDRHFGEIAAFYLSELLGYNAPLTVGRKLNLVKEVLPVSTKQLKNTFYYNKEKDHCFYGVCYFCSPLDPVCAEGEELEGALVLLMNQNMQTMLNPWSRTYKSKTLARWQTNTSYCQNLVLKNINANDHDEFILDIIAVSIFDFLIGNGDRHHFDVLNDTLNSTKYGHSKRILLIDNGKSFGNPYEDYLDILAPLFQCCRIRKPLWTSLKQFQKDQLGESVDLLSKTDPLYPLLTHEHLTALNQRLKILLALVDVCLDEHSFDTVIISK